MRVSYSYLRGLPVHLSKETCLKDMHVHARMCMWLCSPVISPTLQQRINIVWPKVLPIFCINDSGSATIAMSLEPSTPLLMGWRFPCTLLLLDPARKNCTGEPTISLCAYIRKQLKQFAQDVFRWVHGTLKYLRYFTAPHFTLPTCRSANCINVCDLNCLGKKLPAISKERKVVPASRRNVFVRWCIVCSAYRDKVDYWGRETSRSYFHLTVALFSPRVAHVKVIKRWKLKFGDQLHQKKTTQEKN